MASTIATKKDLTDTLDQISDLADDALDPELTREELVVKVKEIADLTAGDDDDTDTDGGDEDEEDEFLGED